MSLQERINELDSSIITVYENRIEITGFMSEERLLDYYNRDINCIFSKGIYPIEAFDLAYIKDKALFIIIEDGFEKYKYNFEVIKNDVLKYKDANNTPKSKVYKIRHCKYSNTYNYKDTEQSLIFDTMDKLKEYLIDEYNFNLDI